VRLSHADAGYIAISEDGRWTLAKSLGAYNEKIINAALNDGKGIVGRVIRDQQAEFVPDLASDPDYQIIIPNLQAKMVIPLLSRERGVIGILNLDTAYPDHFTTQGFEFLKLLTTRIGVAVDNAYLYHKTEEQLLEMQRLYEQVRSLEQIKTDMIRIASHDLRNPLSTIRGYLELLRNELAAKNAESELDYVRSIQDSAQRMSNIISDILSLERIEEAALEKQPFDLRELVRQTHGEHTPQANLKSIELALDIPDAPVQVLGDSVQIHEALANLISNAIKYTPEGGTIQVRLALNDRQAVVEVEDSGYGIPEEMQARLFQPFYRARSKETRHIEGTGLGLHLVKNIIERHSGKMIFHSVYHQGSTFGFELPLLPA
jgi:signal transduction histidine kinase